MKPLKSLIVLSAIAAVISFAACQRNEDPTRVSGDRNLTPVLPAQTLNYNSTANNQNIDNEKATLGRVLFYDRALSANHSIACASCHKQDKGFADNGAFSMGYNFRMTGRNSMAIINIGEFGNLFWDSRESSLTSMVRRPIANHIEMGFDNVDGLVSRVNSIDYYKDLIQKAYGKEALDSNTLAESLAEFVRSIRSSNSKYDEYRKSNNIAVFNALEREGFELFTQKLPCSNCHSEGEFGGWGLANIGLEMNYTDKGAKGWSDFGPFNGFPIKSDARRMGVFEQGEGFFKIPTLRNIEYTAPYMHDGRFATLEDVLNHYSDNVCDHKNLDSRLKMRINPNGSWEMTEGPVRWNLNNHEKQAVIAFLKSLSDPSLRSDIRFSDPFRLN